MNKYLLIALLSLAPVLHAEEAAAPKDAPKKQESRKVHSDPRFKGKVVVIGESSASFGEAPKGDDLKTRKLESFDDVEDPAAPKALPAPASAPKPLAPPAKR